jgi:hypothetical protein
MGLDGKVGLRHVRPEPELELEFVRRFWTGLVGWDVLRQLAAYHRPCEDGAGEVDALYDGFADELERILEFPGRGRGGLRWGRRRGAEREVGEVIERAAGAFAELGARANGHADRDLRTAFLTGDIYLRLDEFGSDGLVRQLNARGLRVVPEPLCALVEYLAAERSSELIGLPTGRVRNAVMRRLLARVRRGIYERARERHPWLPMPDARVMLGRSRALLDRHPIGEAPIAIGSVLHHWRTGACDGIVVVGPWGCGPSLVAESLLRHQREIPIHFVYNDGSPLDRRRLDAFAFQLRRRQRRSVEAETCRPVRMRTRV